DLRYLVPQNDFDPGECSYGSSACTTYLVLYSVWGGKGIDGDYNYGFDGGFEEWKVKVYPKLQVSKDISGSLDTPVSWEITKDFDATYNMFAGESVTHGYEVSVDPIFGDPENVEVSGTITIIGDDEDPVDASIVDLFNGSPATITECSVPENLDGTYTIEADAIVTCSYELGLVAPVDGTNVARASYEQDGVALAFQGSASILADDYVETLTGDPDIDVVDTNGESWSASAASETWTYNRDFECPADTSLYEDGFYSFQHDNTATISQTDQSDDATVVVNCYAPVVEKTAETYFNREWKWSIVKDFDDEYNLFAGDSVQHDYKVSVNPTFTDSYWGVKGDITISNSHPTDDMVLTDVSDLAGGISATVDCPSLIVPSGGELDCTYDTGEQNFPDDNPFGDTNIATAEFAGADWIGTADIIFSADPTTEDDPIITVDDDNLENESWTANRAYEEWEYSREFSCPTDLSLYENGVLELESHINTATINETGQSDIATVDVTCYSLLVSKDANPSFTRTFNWTILKDVDNAGPITLAGGETVVVNYDVTFDLAEPAFVDSAWAVEGTITVDNPAPMNASLSAVSDVIEGGIAANVNCPALIVPAGGELECSYSADLPDAATRTNTATAALLNGTSFSGSADVDFASAEITEIDEMVDVSDSYAGFLGSVHYSEVPKTFSYPRFITAPDLFCGSFTVDNVATLVTNDREITASDDASVIIDVPCQGCTPGFWQGGAGLQLWDDPVTDPQWSGVLAQPFTDDDLFNDIFSLNRDIRLEGQTMLQIVGNDGGIANSAEKAARDMVAAYLNESAFPEAFPADGLQDLLDRWYAAVNDDAALEAFHAQVGGWNDPSGPGYCPLP
ncbi:MAG: hypothetical protein PVI67_06375, partial [Anaerolineae bacterium]